MHKRREVFPILCRTNTPVYAILLLIAFLSIVTASSFSPFNFRKMHVDSSIYITIANGITRGQMPYRDLADNKGPLMYLLSAPGMLLGGFTGVWITELILMFVSLVFAYKTALFFGGKRVALAGVACSFVVSNAFVITSAGPEEYSLPFLMISFYLFTKYYFSDQRRAGIIEITVLGICFACAVLIRLNMFPLWAGFCMIIFAESIITRRFALLGKYILGFCIGIAIVCIPVYFYLKLNGALSDFFTQVVFGGISRGTTINIKQIAKNFYVIINRSYCITPLVFGAFCSITRYKQGDFAYYAGYTFSFLLMILFNAFAGPGNYNMTLIPFIVPALSFFVGLIYPAFLQTRYRKMVFVLFLCIIFSEGFVKSLDDTLEVFTNNSGKELIATGRMIDENTMPGDKIISLGINGYIYPFTKRDSASKYIYQGSGIDLLPGARDEFLSDILNNRPKIIVIAEEDGRYDYLSGWYAPIYKMMDEEYKLLSNKNGYFLFSRP